MQQRQNLSNPIQTKQKKKKNEQTRPTFKWDIILNRIVQ